METFRGLIQVLRRECPGMEIRENEPMAKHTSFKIGGPARGMVLPANENQLSICVKAARDSGVRAIFMGNGSNILAPDEGIDALVIMTLAMDSVTVSGDVVTAGAGALLSRTARAALDAALTGMEFAHGIPGSVGGAVCMNAGAYGGEMKDIVTGVTFVTADGEIKSVGAGELDLRYRHSRFSDSEECVVAVEMKLTKGNAEEIKAKMDDLARRRKESQPLDLPSAGSTFKRPAVGYAAALIDASGLKGEAVGGACVSAKHAGFIVNTGGATAQDVKELMTKVTKKVKEDSGVELEPEVKIL